jgi:hypothetical protein
VVQSGVLKADVSCGLVNKMTIQAGILHPRLLLLRHLLVVRCPTTRTTGTSVMQSQTSKTTLPDFSICLAKGSAQLAHSFCYEFSVGSPTAFEEHPAFFEPPLR